MRTTGPGTGLSPNTSVKRGHPVDKDLELNTTASRHLDNDAVRHLSWRDVSVIVKDRQTKSPRSILTCADGYVQAGQMVALMGPSGSGKTTLLNVLAHRITNTAESTGQVLINGQPIDRAALRQVSCYVEQEDHLIGSLTVRETLDFAARLALPSSISKAERLRRVDDLVRSFGLQEQASTLVGTPIRKGISGGQKRRVSVASQLVTSPKVLFLDEPTSGLDSVASFEVMNFIKELATRHRLVVVASIHQPSTKTFGLFDRLMLLSGGRTCYFGPINDIHAYFSRISYEIPVHTNPAEYLLDLVNIDFARDKTKAAQQLQEIQEAWSSSKEAKSVNAKLATTTDNEPAEKNSSLCSSLDNRSKMLLPVTLLHRSFIKSYRDVIAYGIRLVMYSGLAIMMGTVWLRLSDHQSSIISFINAIFFGGAFMVSPPPLRSLVLSISSSNALPSPSWQLPTSLPSSKTYKPSRKNGPMVSTARCHSSSQTQSSASRTSSSSPLSSASSRTGCQTLSPRHRHFSPG